MRVGWRLAGPDYIWRRGGQLQVQRLEWLNVAHYVQKRTSDGAQAKFWSAGYKIKGAVDKHDLKSDDQNIADGENSNFKDNGH